MFSQSRAQVGLDLSIGALVLLVLSFLELKVYVFSFFGKLNIITYNLGKINICGKRDHQIC